MGGWIMEKNFDGSEFKFENIEIVDWIAEFKT